MHNEFKLNPAQKLFVRKNIRDFDSFAWIMQTAGKSGSNREFIRIFSPDNKTCGSYILMLWSRNDSDWERFFHIYELAHRETRLVPCVIAYDSENGFILEEDLGKITLKKKLSGVEDSEERMELYKQVISKLAVWHNLCDKTGCVSQKRVMSEKEFLWESSYFFKHCVKEYFNMRDICASDWEEERTETARAASSVPRVFIHRDFQSENIMISGSEIKFVDFQGARYGPSEYDIASLLWDPYVNMLSTGNIESLVEYYCKISKYGVSMDSFYLISTQRLMQAVGAYANLGLNMGKTWYLDYIPAALKRLGMILSRDEKRPVLKYIVESGISRSDKKCSGI